MVPYLVFMAVFTDEHVRSSWMIYIVAYRSDVNEKTAFSIDPPCVNMIRGVLLVAVVIIRVDLEHVVAAISDPGGLVMENRHVVVGGEIM